MQAPTLVVQAVEAGVRPVKLRLPFRFGSVTLNACPQLFVRVQVELDGGRSASGFAAEMMVPKWFDKRAGFSHLDNIAHLGASVERAATAYAGDRPASAFALFTRHYAALMRAGEQAGATALSAAYGQALIDRAVLDALCRATQASFFDAVRHNHIGLQDSELVPDLRGFDWTAWLPTLQPLRQLAARHTVGMLDALAPVHDDDGELPVSLPAVIQRYGHHVFKIKLGGDPPGRHRPAARGTGGARRTCPWSPLQSGRQRTIRGCCRAGEPVRIAARHAGAAQATRRAAVHRATDRTRPLHRRRVAVAQGTCPIADG